MHGICSTLNREDHGKTLQVSELENIPGSNESTATELSNNKLMMNSRNQKSDIRARIVSISSNGGAARSTSYFYPSLIDPVKQGSILPIGTGKSGRDQSSILNIRV